MAPGQRRKCVFRQINDLTTYPHLAVSTTSHTELLGRCMAPAVLGKTTRVKGWCVGVPARIGGRCPFIQLPGLLPVSVAQASFIAQGSPQPAALKLEPFGALFPTVMHPQKQRVHTSGSVLLRGCRCRVSEPPSPPPMLLTEPLHTAVFQQLFCKQASKWVTLNQGPT